MSAYDAAAPSFDCHRALPRGVIETIRATILASIEVPAQPRLLDLGAGTGRIGLPFVAAGDDYVGVDLSLGMLREFARRGGADRQGNLLRLVCTDGRQLPFADATFDAVMLIQVVGAAWSWRRLVAEARRTLRSPGALVIGQSAMPANGLDEQMKRRLASLLEEMGVPPYHIEARKDIKHWLDFIGRSDIYLIAAEWETERTPRSFLSRQRTGARFSTLPEPVQEEALRKLSAWAIATFGSLDSVFAERHTFELRIFREQVGA